MTAIMNLMEGSYAGAVAEHLGDSYSYGTTLAAGPHIITQTIVEIIEVVIGVGDMMRLPLVGEAKKVPLVIKNADPTLIPALVYPANGESIDSLGTDNPLTLNGASSARFWPIAPARWISVIRSGL